MYLIKIKESPPKLIQKVTAWTSIPISYCILVKLFTWTSLLAPFLCFLSSIAASIIWVLVSWTLFFVLANQFLGPLNWQSAIKTTVIVQNLVGRKRSSTRSSSDPFGWTKSWYWNTVQQEYYSCGIPLSAGSFPLLFFSLWKLSWTWCLFYAFFGLQNVVLEAFWNWYIFISVILFSSYNLQ